MTTNVAMKQFETGAVRSSDAEGYRYDLLSPKVLRAFVAQNAASLQIGAALHAVATYLEGDSPGRLLSAAGVLGVASGRPLGEFQLVAEALHEGASKYSDFNWERGMPVSDLLNHAIRHLLFAIKGDESEDHVAHAAWNLFAAYHSELSWPHLNEKYLTEMRRVRSLAASRLAPAQMASVAPECPPQVVA